MKRQIFLLSMIFVSSIAFAIESTDLSMTVRALENAIAQFQSMSVAESNYDVVLKRDPLRPLVNESGNVIFSAGLHDGLLVQGIIYSSELKTALVDDRFYGEGDSVGPYKILRIERNGFYAEGPEGEVFVPLYPEEQNPVSN